MKSDSISKSYSRADIDELIFTQAEESVNLEFKRGDALRKGRDSVEKEKIKSDIAKDVSAFANSDGGVIIYGIEEINHRAAKVFYVNGHEFTKETLEQVINSRIQRRIDGIIIEPIRYDEKVEKTIYVVKIPASKRAPHMTTDKKYYRRYNFQAVEMEEYEVRNLYSRPQNTILQIGEPNVTSSRNISKAEKIVELETKVEFSIKNIGNTIENLYKLEVKIPHMLAVHSNAFRQQPFFNFLVKHELPYSLFILPGTVPIFQNDEVVMGIAELKLTKTILNHIKSSPLLVKLFFSSGTDEIAIDIAENLIVGDRKIAIDDFAD
jgi:hypothetical protein